MSKNIASKFSPLGKEVEYVSKYDCSLLFPVSRKIARENNYIDENIFKGFDIWNCYELSWLDKKGKPLNALLRIIYPSESENIVESKSLKLYLNSFNMTKFKDEADVLEVIEEDLNALLGVQIKLQLFSSADKAFVSLKFNESTSIDEQNIEIEDYKINHGLLETHYCEKMEHEAVSFLLKTNCPVTGQPDWGTVHIKYLADKYILEESLLKYIISYRKTDDFHEVCCEKIFTDIYNLIRPEKLYVKCYYTRRGGIDINPVRYMGYDIDESNFLLHAWRQ